MRIFRKPVTMHNVVHCGISRIKSIWPYMSESELKYLTTEISQNFPLHDPRTKGSPRRWTFRFSFKDSCWENSLGPEFVWGHAPPGSRRQGHSVPNLPVPTLQSEPVTSFPSSDPFRSHISRTTALETKRNVTSSSPLLHHHYSPSVTKESIEVILQYGRKRRSISSWESDSKHRYSHLNKSKTSYSPAFSQITPF
jgi:hypothetical protein